MSKKRGKQRTIKSSKLSPIERPPGIGAACRSHPLRRDFPREACPLRADAKLVSSRKDCCWEVAGRLEISNFRGIFRFRLLGGNGFCWVQEKQEQAKQLAHTRSAPLPRHLLFAPLALMLCQFEGCHHDTKTHWYPWQCEIARQPAPNKHADHLPLGLRMLTLRGSTDCTRSLLDVMPSAMVTDSESLVNPNSKKKLLCVKCGLRTECCTQSRTPRTSLSSMATQSRLILKLSPRVAGPSFASAVNRTILNVTVSWVIETPHMQVQNNVHDWIRHILYKVLPSTETSLCRTERQDVYYVRAAPRGRPLQVPLFVNKGQVLSPARFNFAPSGQLFLGKPIRDLVEQLERSAIIPTNHGCKEEAAHTLSYEQSWSNNWRQKIHTLLKEATGITAKLNRQILAANFVRRGH